MIPEGAILQTSDQWIPARRGNVTTSRQADVAAKLKSGAWAKAATDYAIELVAERACDYAVERAVTPPMLRGLELEPVARAAYEARTGELVDPAALVPHRGIPEWLSTPDGWIGADGLLEIKCPLVTTFVRWSAEGVVPEQHVPQLTGQQCVTGREWTDFVAYCPEMPEGRRLFVRRFVATQEQRDAVTQVTVEFLEMVDSLFIKFTHNLEA